MRLFKLFKRSTRSRARRTPASRTRPLVEQLETRLVPYALTGGVWPSPQLVTISFVPDGTLMTTGVNGNVYNSLFAKLNPKGSTATWQNEILKAAQTWAAVANVNFDVVSDNGTVSGQGLYQQGDPGMGDIRVGGYSYGNTTTLAATYAPPPLNNFSIAGDINFNTDMTFNINGTSYDLRTAALHEFGHALGLDHSTVGSSAAMWQFYTGTKRSLSSDDIAGVQAIYGARPGDVYYTAPIPNNSFAAAADLTAKLDPVALTAAVNNLDISTKGQTEYYTVFAPLTTNGTFQLTVQSAGLSMLTPAVTVYAADQITVLGSATLPVQYHGVTESVTVNGVTPGQQLYVKVTGADLSAFGTGAYAMTLNFGTAATPAVTLPKTSLLNGTPLTGGGAIALAVVDLLTVAPTTTPADNHSDDSSHRDDQPEHSSHTACDACFADGDWLEDVLNPLSG